MRIYALLMIFIISSTLQAQEKRDPAELYASSISADELKKHLMILASDEYEGRETGQEGQKMAARYIAALYKDLGYKPVGENGTYFQTIPLVKEVWGEVNAEVGEKKFEFLKDFYSFARNTQAQKLDVDEVTFLGYGINDEKYSDYKGMNVKGKVCMVFGGEPGRKGVNIISGSSSPSSWTTNWRKKLEAASMEGVTTLLVIVDDVEENVNNYGSYIQGGSMKLDAGKSSSDGRPKYAQTIYISREMAKTIAGKSWKKILRSKKKMDKKGTAGSREVPSSLVINVGKRKERNDAENVFAYVEGSDLKDEVVVLTAHYDHLGKRGDKVYNGADDNGTGTVCMLEIAEAFSKAKEAGNGPRRSILIFNNSGEEKGLLGSEYYTENPLYPLENTVACLNVDMVGRSDEFHKDNNDPYVYIIGSNMLSTELHDINESANKTYVGINLDYHYNSKNDPQRFYYRSDHYNFAKNNIPSIFYFNGTHEDYHQPSDTPDKIQYDNMEKIARLVFHTAWTLANQDKRIEVDVND